MKSCTSLRKAPFFGHPPPPSPPIFTQKSRPPPSMIFQNSHPTPKPPPLHKTRVHTMRTTQHFTNLKFEAAKMQYESRDKDRQSVNCRILGLISYGLLSKHKPNLHI